MRYIFFSLLILITSVCYSQEKKSFISYGKMYDIKGTDNVIICSSNYSKMKSSRNSLLFINTLNGKEVKIDCPKNTYIETIQQIKLDSLDINKVILLTRSVDESNKKFMNTRINSKVIICNTEGDSIKQITDGDFQAKTWTLNEKNGILVIAGYNKRKNNEIILFDLKKMERIGVGQ